MERIFKNDTIMGIVAIATLVLVAYSFIKNRKESDEIATVSEKIK